MVSDSRDGESSEIGLGMKLVGSKACLRVFCFWSVGLDGPFGIPRFPMMALVVSVSLRWVPGQKKASENKAMYACE